MLNFFKDAGVSLSMDGDRLKVEGLKQLPQEQANEIRQKIQDNRGKIISELQIPAPSTPGMGPEYERIWNRAWELAEWIDDPAAAPIEQRRAKLPELDDLRARMAAICSNGTDKPAPPAAQDPETSPPGTWHPWESTGATTRDRSADTCPARCKQTGKCYAAAYFEGKPGPAAECTPEDCN